MKVDAGITSARRDCRLDLAMKGHFIHKVGLSTPKTFVFVVILLNTNQFVVCFESSHKLFCNYLRVCLGTSDISLHELQTKVFHVCDCFFFVRVPFKIVSHLFKKKSDCLQSDCLDFSDLTYEIQMKSNMGLS